MKCCVYLQNVTQIFIQSMAKVEMTEEELQAFMELRMRLMHIDMEDPVIEPEFAKDIVEKARLLSGSQSLSNEEKAKYAKVAEIFSEFC